MYRVATGGVKLQVPADLAGEARVILSQSWSVPGDEGDDDFDFDDVGDDRAPAPSSIPGWALEALIILVLAGPALIWLLMRLLGPSR